MSVARVDGHPYLLAFTAPTTGKACILDSAAFRQLLLNEIDAVYRLAVSLVGHAGDPDDLVQETYLRAIRSKTDFQLTTYGVRPYLFKILHNVLNTRLAKHRHEPEVAPIPVGSRQAPETPARADDLANFDWEAVDGDLKHAIEALPTMHRIVFLLCAVEGLRYREIADIVGVPVGTIMSRLHRARELLVAQLSQKKLDETN